MIAVPVVALLALLGLLISSDISALQDLRRFERTSERVAAQVEVRATLQIERHAVTAPMDIDGLPMTMSEIDDALTAIGFVGGSEFTDDLRVARQLAESNRRTQAVLLYTELINSLARDIENDLESAPFGLADQRSTGLRALLDGEESLLLEDLETRQVRIDPLRLNELHTSATSSLTLFSENASANGFTRLEQLTVSNVWRELNLIRLASGTSAGNGMTFDRESWAPAAEQRNEILADLVVAETDTMTREIQFTIDSEYRRLGILGLITSLAIIFAFLAAYFLRRSIVAPLAALTANARQLAGGQPAQGVDDASDEIGEMSRAFTVISDTMEHLWADVDTVATAVTKGKYDKRIETAELPGDWLRLAETMNATLATGEEHRILIQEELDRRGALAEISNAAAMSSTAQSLTSAVLQHLPTALAGSRARLHLHPLGPPTVGLGVQLQPSISALALPADLDRGHLIELRTGPAIVSLVAFPEGPPAVLVLTLGATQPTQIEPLISLVETSAQILSQAHRRHAAESEVEHVRGHDLLTNLPNSEFTRHWFTERADRSIPWSILGVQPQRLDELDGRMGRSSRDQLMKAIAEELADVIADSTGPLNFEIVLARLTKPDFAVIAPSTERESLAQAFAQRFSEPIMVDDTAVEIGATIAFDEISLTDRDLTQSITNVSAAVAQAEGRETEVIAFEEDHREALRRRGEIGEWLSHAIANRDLSVHFQPIVNAMTTAIEGYEVLVRGSMDGQPLSPGEFIPVAEDTGVITAIGQFVLREACAALPFLRGEDPFVSVNLSPVQLSQVDLLDNIERVLVSSNVPRERVTFEVTEGATATPEGLERLRELRELGVRIAIDDFGSGQSNLAYLNELPAQVLKLDRSLVTPIPHDEGAATLVEKAIEMAHALGMTVVGEGVETRTELDALRNLECDRIQGWFTGRPGPLKDFIEITVDQTSIRIASEDDR